MIKFPVALKQLTVNVAAFQSTHVVSYRPVQKSAVYDYQTCQVTGQNSVHQPVSPSRRSKRKICVLPFQASRSCLRSSVCGPCLHPQRQSHSLLLAVLLHTSFSKFLLLPPFPLQPLGTDCIEPMQKFLGDPPVFRLAGWETESPLLNTINPCPIAEHNRFHRLGCRGFGKPSFYQSQCIRKYFRSL